MRRQDKRKRKRSKSSFLLRFFLIVLLVGAGITFMFYQFVEHTLSGEDLYSDKRMDGVSFQDKEGFTVLLLGVDEQEGDIGRSDTMLFMSVNRGDNKTKILSIPRDTRVEIAGKGTKDKINHAYAFGGVKMAAKTVENFFDVPVDCYVEINMKGLQEIVDAVGGVEVQNDFAFSYGGDDFAEGRITLSGSEALNYTRMRKEDPNGDFGRQARQRQVIESILNKGNDLGMVFRFTDMMKAIRDNVQTNLSFGDVIAIYASTRNNIESLTIDGNDERIDGVYYYVVDDEEVSRVSDEFKEDLNLK
ncbi:LCP family protein [Domibacillus mangrovi]|uniref:LytR family transcriptional regulator n=1 Tax=Domibacillus mangrovi TaxID=1714354 RepID=A0A1Q5P473_9BACI|nr:LCP family protein [Domibacillus mangrovi]OKL36892.1 LytR family transcriptional regulator [Domibacillus mangrovi]